MGTADPKYASFAKSAILVVVGMCIMMVINTFMSTSDFRAAASVHADGRRPAPPVDKQAHALRYDTVMQMRTRQYNRTDNACNFDLTVLKQNFAQLVKTELYALGLMDAGELAPYLYRYFNHRIDSVIIDVGANLGDTTARLMSLFTVSDCERFHANVHLNGSFDNCEYWKSQVIAIEPVPSTFQKLVERAKTEFWTKTSFEAHQLALTDNVAPGEMVKFYSKGTQGDQQGGLNTFSSGGAEFLEVPADTLDHFVSTLKYNRNAPIFLLKVDCEGFDASVLNGTRALLTRKAIKFVVAEYNKKWSYRGSPWNLQKAVAFMEKFGYQCYLLTPTHIIPLYGKWWDPAFEFGYWSNFFCSPECDADTLSLINYYNHEHLLPPGSCTC